MLDVLWPHFFTYFNKCLTFSRNECLGIRWKKSYFFGDEFWTQLLEKGEGKFKNCHDFEEPPAIILFSRLISLIRETFFLLTAVRDNFLVRGNNEDKDDKIFVLGDQLSFQTSESPAIHERDRARDSLVTRSWGAIRPRRKNERKKERKEKRRKGREKWSGTRIMSGRHGE